MERYVCAIPIVGGILTIIFPSQAREVYAALSTSVWLRDFTLRCSDFAFRVLGIGYIVFGIFFFLLEQTTPR